MNEFNIGFSGNIVLLFIFLLTGIGLSLLIYMKTNSPISRGKRIFLSIMRTLTLLLIISLIFDPILSYTRELLKKPGITFLIDNSRSMSITDSRYNRAEKMREIINSETLIDFSDRFTVRFSTFSGEVANIESDRFDSLRFDEEGTDIARALEQIEKENNSKAVLLFTDGAYNMGENPERISRNLNLPVYVIAVGDSSPQKDIMISNVQYNAIGYLNDTVSVDVYVKSYGLPGKNTEVSVKKNGKVLDTKMLSLPEDFLEKKITLRLTPEETGFNEFEITVNPYKGELTTENNTKSFLIKVLKNRYRFLILSGKPSPDFSFIKRALMRNENYVVDELISKKGNRFYYGNDAEIVRNLSLYDAFIFIDFPKKDVHNDLTGKIKNEIKKRNVPFLFAFGKGYTSGDCSLFDDILPFQFINSTGKEIEAYGRLTEEGIKHPALRLDEDISANLLKWNKFPPIFTLSQFINPLRNTGILLWTEKKTAKNIPLEKEIPVILSGKIKGIKSLIINGFNIWRWKLTLTDDTSLSEFFDRIINNCVRWLVNKEEDKQVRIYPNKEFFSSGEEIKINAEVYDENYEPVIDAEVKVEIRGENFITEKLLKSAGEGKYTENVEILEAGNYRYTGNAYYKERQLGSDNGNFLIEKFSKELLNTEMNSALLQKIAVNTNGKLYIPENFINTFTDITLPDEKFTLSWDFAFWDKELILLLIILFFSVELFFRKRWGLL